MINTPRQVKVLRWGVFQAFLSLLPFFLAYVIGLLIGQVPALVQLLRGGELMLIAAALQAGAVGELFALATASTRQGAEILFAGLAMLNGLLAAVGYAVVVVAAPPEGISVSESAVATLSAVLFISALALSAGCVALSER